MPRRAFLLLVFLAACGRGATGPQPIAWDREPCGHCRMVISEKGYAAQAIGDDGRALSFDDPGCLLAWLNEGHPAREIWLHHAREDRWLRAPAAAFVKAEKTPMGYNLAAVDPGTPGSVGFAEALKGARP